VAVTRVKEDVGEVLICNNYGHTVTRHLLDRAADGAMRNSEILLNKYLNGPDGVSLSPDRRWIAVSNHTTHNVLLYENSPALNSDAKPDGILRCIYYPHGLRFSADGRHLFVADAGAPYLHIYAQDPDQWRGVRLRSPPGLWMRRCSEGGAMPNSGLKDSTSTCFQYPGGHLRCQPLGLGFALLLQRVRRQFGRTREDSQHQSRTQPHARDPYDGREGHGQTPAEHGDKRLAEHHIVAHHRTVAAPQVHLPPG
jgi:hypothetical protein